jgi:thymidylate synthase, flavin-dependent|nr:MAG TPA: FAD-dependent thymidylate synthase [Caudoviricetes sp.]
MKVTLLHHIPLSIAVTAARTCWDSFNKGGIYECPSDTLVEADIALLDKLIHKNKHESIAEHISYSWSIEGLPRFVLAELTRHRLCSYSVKSTRYTLKELKNEAPFFYWADDETDEIEHVKLAVHIDRAKKYIDINPKLNVIHQTEGLERLRMAVCQGGSLDDVKYLVPENYLTNLVWTINVRSLRNFLHLRLSKSAHFKIRELAELIYDAIPNEHKFLFEDLRKEEND